MKHKFLGSEVQLTTEGVILNQYKNLQSIHIDIVANTTM